MKNKKTAMLTTLSILTLSMIGFTYAMWSETLTISGSVAAGEVDWEFTGVSCIDNNDNLDYHCNDGFEGHTFWEGDKDVGSTSVQIVDPHKVAVTLDNVYPCYFTSVNLYTLTTGTIPLIFDAVIINDEVVLRTASSVVGLNLDGLDGDDVEIWWGNGFGEQRHPGYPFPEMSFWIHVLQTAPQDAHLSFTMELVAVQYNEYVKP